jgi:hypothetical protein
MDLQNEARLLSRAAADRVLSKSFVIILFTVRHTQSSNKDHNNSPSEKEPMLVSIIRSKAPFEDAVRKAGTCKPIKNIKPENFTIYLPMQ